MAVGSTSHTLLYVISVVYRDQPILTLKLCLTLYFRLDLSHHIWVAAFSQVLLFLF